MNRISTLTLSIALGLTASSAYAQIPPAAPVTPGQEIHKEKQTIHVDKQAIHQDQHRIATDNQKIQEMNRRRQEALKSNNPAEAQKMQAEIDRERMARRNAEINMRHDQSDIERQRHLTDEQCARDPQCARNRGQNGNRQAIQPAQTPAQTPNANLGAAPGSVEAQLTSQGKKWSESDSPIGPGGYVEDILNGRLNQPQGRGDIAKVISVTKDASGQSYATVDFGRGYTVNILTSELSSVHVEP